MFSEASVSLGLVVGSRIRMKVALLQDVLGRRAGLCCRILSPRYAKSSTVQIQRGVNRAADRRVRRE